MKFMISVLVAISILCGCEPSSDELQSRQQEQILREGTSAVGMPAIKNFREKRILKDIIELCDQDGLTTYTYLWNEINGRLVFLGETIGYGIPYATQFTNPQKRDIGSTTVLPQADPNGLFKPSSADGTWILLKDPSGGAVKPVFVEPRIIVSPFKLAQ